MPADFARIAAGRSQTHIDVPCAAWDLDGSNLENAIRLQRLDGPALFAYTMAAEQLTHDDDGNPTEPDRSELYKFGVDLLAASIIDDEGNLIFDTPDKRHWLSGEIRAISELLDPAMQLNGIGSASVTEQKKS